VKTQEEDNKENHYSQPGVLHLTVSVKRPVAPRENPLTSTSKDIALLADSTGIVSELCVPHASSTVALQELQFKPHDSRASYACAPKLAIELHVSTTTCWPAGTDTRYLKAARQQEGSLFRLTHSPQAGVLHAVAEAIDWRADCRPVDDLAAGQRGDVVRASGRRCGRRRCRRQPRWV
jgi:hypothetical protein